MLSTQGRPLSVRWQGQEKSVEEVQTLTHADDWQTSRSATLASRPSRSRTTARALTKAIGKASVRSLNRVPFFRPERLTKTTRALAPRSAQAPHVEARLFRRPRGRPDARLPRRGPLVPLRRRDPLHGDQHGCDRAKGDDSVVHERGRVRPTEEGGARARHDGQGREAV